MLPQTKLEWLLLIFQASLAFDKSAETPTLRVEYHGAPRYAA
jgi:hypothetical protein